RITVGIAFRIEARARIAVPVPGAPDTGAGFEHPHGQTHLPQAIELIQPGDTRADDNGVEAAGRDDCAVRGIHRCIRHADLSLPSSRLGPTGAYYLQLVR